MTIFFSKSFVSLDGVMRPFIPFLLPCILKKMKSIFLMISDTNTARMSTALLKNHWCVVVHVILEIVLVSFKCLK